MRLRSFKKCKGFILVLGILDASVVPTLAKYELKPFAIVCLLSVRVPFTFSFSGKLFVGRWFITVFNIFQVFLELPIFWLRRES